MNSDFSSRDKGSASETFPNLAQVNLLSGYPHKGVLTLEIVIYNLLAVSESNIKFMDWPITSQRGVLGGSVVYSLDEFFSKPTAVIDLIHKFCNDFVFWLLSWWQSFFLLSYSLPQKVTGEDS